jgi:hypothetical protein
MGVEQKRCHPSTWLSQFWKLQVGADSAACGRRSNTECRLEIDSTSAGGAKIHLHEKYSGLHRKTILNIFGISVGIERFVSRIY